MRFVTQQDVFDAVEPVMRGVFEEFSGGKTVTPKFPLIPYAEAMRAYGSDKPDLRNPIKIVDVSDEFNDPSVTFNAFKNIIKAGGVVRAIPAPGAAAKPRSWFDGLNEWARSDLKAGGLAYIVFQKIEPAKVEAGGPIAKFMSPEVLQRMASKAGLQSGDVLFFSAGKEADAARVAGAARTRFGEELSLIDKKRFEL